MSAAIFVQWLLDELFCLAEDGTPEENALLRASIVQDLRVLRLQQAAV